MNNKGQQFTVAAVILLFISLLVGLVLFPIIGQYVGSVTDTYFENATITGVQFTMPADGATIDLTGQELMDTPFVQNASGTTIVCSGADTNCTIAEGVSTSTGLKRIRLTANGTEHQGQTLNISYEYGPEGYIDSAGGRSITTLITLFFALAIALVALVPSFRNKLFDLIGK